MRAVFPLCIVLNIARYQFHLARSAATIRDGHDDWDFRPNVFNKRLPALVVGGNRAACWGLGTYVATMIPPTANWDRTDDWQQLGKYLPENTVLGRA